MFKVGSFVVICRKGVYAVKRMFCLAMAGAAMAAAAVTAPDLVTNEALFWLDATTFSDVASGTEITAWPDARGSSYPGVTSYKSVKPQVIEISDGDLAGKKAVTFFTAGTQCDMRFNSQHTVKTVFFVLDIDQTVSAFLLGADNSYDFHRGTGGQYSGNYSPARDAAIWNSGKRIASTTSEVIPTGYQMLTISSSAGQRVQNICKDRECYDGNVYRIGGKRVCELIAFTRVLGDGERSLVEGYLKRKWYGSTQTQAEATLEMLGYKAQVHFDASVESSFHYGDDGTSVTQWDDLSLNANHFTASITSQTPNYGTRGTVAEKPVYDSGAPASGIDLVLNTRITNTRTVFMATELAGDASLRVFWLGDPSSINFHRGNNGQYTYPNGNCFLQSELGGMAWCNGIAVPNTLNCCPDPSGGISVYTLQPSSDSAWSKLGQDRAISGRNGGKRVAELFTFASVFSDGDRAIVENALMEKWAPSEEYVDSILAAAAIHVDASSPDNFQYTDGKITGWKNSALAGDMYRQDSLYRDRDAYTTEYGSYGFTNGIPAFLMGPRGSSIDLSFPRLTNIRSVFWVMDIEHAGVSFFLADAATGVLGTAANLGTTYHFHRNYTGEYANSNAANGWKYGSINCDGVIVVPWTAKPPHGAHLFDVQASSSLTASALSMDRWCYDTTTNRNGGRAISELLVLTNEVAGLTQKAIRERIAKKWTTSCGWAGEGDSEWGAANYRVFGENVTVPTDGAAANGVGFTASATMDGGTLTLGDAGIFAAEGAEVAVTATLAGKVGVYGPGTVAVGLGSIDTLTVGYGATLMLTPGTTEISGTLSLQENSKIVIDVSSLADNEYASITFDSLLIPAGGSVLDYVSLSDDSEDLLTFSADENKIEINNANMAVAAVWEGSADADVADPANWKCYNFKGEVLEGGLPSAVCTTSVTFNAACDLSEQSSVAFRPGTMAYLNGQSVKVSSFDVFGEGSTVVGGSPGLELVASEAVMWLDASAASTLEVDESGKVSRWSSIAGTTMALQTNADKQPVLDTTTYGFPTVDFGSAGSGKDMTFGELSNIKTAFWALKIEKTLGAFWLGSTSVYHFHRGEQGQYSAGYSNFSKMWNGTTQVNISSEYPTADEFIFVAAEMKSASRSNSLTNDRNINGRNGGKKLSELICFSRDLTDAERTAVTEYLQQKWLSNNAPVVGELHVVVDSEASLNDANITLKGNVMLVKEGAGTLTASKGGQCYIGGTKVMAGTLALGNATDPLGNGNATQTIFVEKGATFNGGTYANDGTCCYNFQAGGNLVFGSSNNRAIRRFGSLELVDDVSFSLGGVSGFGGTASATSMVTLNGHTLSISSGGDSQIHYVKTKDAGVIDFVTGYLSGYQNSDLSTATVQVSGNANVHLGDWGYSVGDFSYSSSAEFWQSYGAYPINVYGAYLAAAFRPPLAMQDGSTLDLSGVTGSWDSSGTAAYRAVGVNITDPGLVSFTGNITIDLGGRKDVAAISSSDSPYLIKWSSQPDATFVLSEKFAKVFRLAPDETGLRISYVGGFIIYIR